ncbi:hypothetical protein H4R21_000939 [Coemansia helicoidea]|uniref:Uncharacterized protein n=1 Tax=Coemansia helicoidea TaxID=1286919 RepID=A0ACC1LDK3_9FUNG|nr:hypothetical protein H4R21_000939 [Coemansia helicoidea]
MPMLRAIAARFGIPDSALAHFTPVQLQAFLQSLQAQHSQRAQMHAGAEAPSAAMATPQRPAMPSAAQPHAEPSLVSPGLSGKGIAQVRSGSGSPTPVHHQQHQLHGGANAGGPHLFSPTALHGSHMSPQALGSPAGLAYSPRVLGGGGGAIQRKGSAASLLTDDVRGTPAPAEQVYTAEEIAAAHKKSEEFLKRLPEFTSASFVEFLQQFLKEHNIPGNFSKPPVFADRSIDLYRFFCEVIRQGGLEQVHARRVWRQVAKDSGLPDIPTLPPLLSRWYKVWLQPLEQLVVFPPGHPTHTGINANFSLKKRRKQDTFGSPGSTPAPSERATSAHLDLAKRPKTHGPSVNGIASATASPAQATTPYGLSLHSPPPHFQRPPPPPPPPQMPTLPAAGHPIAPELALPLAPPMPTNGAVHHPPPPPLAPAAVAPVSGTGTPSASLVTFPAPPPPVPLRFFPLERSVDTFGGVDLQACVSLRSRIRLPAISDYGSVDIQALTLSIDSGITMEVTAALNTLIRITAHPDVVLPLGQCEALAETLFGILEAVKVPACRAPQEAPGAPTKSTNGDAVSSSSSCCAELPTYSGEAALFGDMCVNDPDSGGIVGDDMQDPTAVRGLLLGGDDLWSFTSDRTLSVVYALRNLSFLPANQQFCAESTDFARAVVALVAKCEQAVRAARAVREGATDGAPASLTVLRALEFRKSLVVMLANIADKIDLQGVGAEFVHAALRLVSYFVDDRQTSDVASEWMSESIGSGGADPMLAAIAHVKALDGRVYYLHALEAAARLTSSSKNREALVAAADPQALRPLAAACGALLAGHQMAVAAAPGAQHCHASEQRLMWVQMALLVLSNLACAATPQPLVAARKYTPFRVSAGGLINQPSANGAQTNGAAAQASVSRRAAARRPMPFQPVVYASAVVPDSIREFRRELAGDTGCVRALFEFVMQWWMQIGAQCAHAPAAAAALYDSPLNDLAERAVYVLQLLHPEHDALFAAQWRQWIVEHVAACGFPPAVVEVLYELVGMIPVQPTPPPCKTRKKDM